MDATTPQLPASLTEDPAALARLREAGRAAAGPFVDPTLVHTYTAAVTATPLDWREQVLGRSLGGLRDHGPTWPELVVLALAAQADADYLAAREQALRAEGVARRARELAAAETRDAAAMAGWVALRDKLPVPVRVRHNWTIGHYEFHVTGKDHIVVTAELRAGRLHRPAWSALCQSPSRDHDLRSLDRDPTSDYAEDRVPTCLGCLRVAHRLAGNDDANSGGR